MEVYLNRDGRIRRSEGHADAQWGLVEDQEDLEKVEAYYQRNPLPE